MTFSVTLKDLRTAGACVAGYNKVACALKGIPFDPDKESYIRYEHTAEIPLEFILDAIGLADALWATLRVQGYDRDLRLFAVWCARQVQHLSTGPEVQTCLDTAERFAEGAATAEELTAARDAARDAAWDAAGDAAGDAAWAAAWAARDAAWDAARAARDAAGAATWAAAGDAAWDAARAEQETMFRKMLRWEAPWQEVQS